MTLLSVFIVFIIICTYVQFKRKSSGGSGLLNRLINSLPFEIHLPGYQLERGDPGINPLDAHCREHDISYRDNKDLESRHRADKILERGAWDRLRASDATIGERAAALTIGAIMKAKRKMGMGVKRRGRRRLTRSSLLNLRRTIAKKWGEAKTCKNL
ncbi:hypothetical protein RI129_000564 [Pyrocoelia pectoralis]|uniref:Phospholipase A2-like domain-containing protein n=1 Tax=Pyrocoelia pectoralis TaxID=417401 RepID=A0AAN7ZJE3_9COLE